ncbi:MAG: serine hydrolase [Rubrobacteraceae bacterium]
MNLSPKRKLFGSRSDRRQRRRRRRLILLVMAAILLAGGLYVVARSQGGPFLGGELLSKSPGKEPEQKAQGEAAQASSKKEAPEKKSAEKAESKPPPVPKAAKETPAGAAYWAVAPELPGVEPESVQAVYRSKIDPSWASVHITAPGESPIPSGEEPYYAVFVHHEGKVWKAERSIRADEPDYAANELVPLAGIPKDLVEYLYERNVFAAKVPEPEQVELNRDALPGAGPAMFPKPEPVLKGVPDSDRERVEEVARQAGERIGNYGGIAGIYVRDLNKDYGYGVRPDEKFFSASIIKIPVMVAVYRKVDEGELKFSQEVEIEEEDWAAGAGWLQWEDAGTKQTVGDLLLLMMTQSDNVATNALVRTVGGADHVNEVARSLGAKNTLLYQKLSSERAAVPALDNHTTPRDMAIMLEKIARKEAASPQSCEYMVELMYTNELDWWLDAGLPANVYAANKAGWLYKVYSDVGIVNANGRRYVVSIMSKYGPEDVNEGELLIEDLSRATWEAQGNETTETPEGEGDSSGKNGS